MSCIGSDLCLERLYRIAELIGPARDLDPALALVDCEPGLHADGAKESPALTRVLRSVLRIPRRSKGQATSASSSLIALLPKF
jgi:hypothetical protein